MSDVDTILGLLSAKKRTPKKEETKKISFQKLEPHQCFRFRNQVCFKLGRQTYEKCGSAELQFMEYNQEVEPLNMAYMSGKKIIQ